MRCTICFKANAEYFCPCEKLLMCSSHTLEHIGKACGHAQEKNDISLTASESEKYSSHALDMIKILGVEKKKLIAFYRKLIKTLDNQCKALLKNLEKSQRYYLKFIGINKVSKSLSEEADKMLKLELNVSNHFFNVTQLFEEISFDNAISISSISFNHRHPHIYSISHVNYRTEIKTIDCMGKIAIQKKYEFSNYNTWDETYIKNEIEVTKKCSDLSNYGLPFLLCYGIREEKGISIGILF